SNVGQISIFIQSRPGAACRAWWGLCVMVLIILLLFCCNATAQIIRLPKVVPKVGTNLCHITVDFDRVPEAQWYAVIVRWDSNRAEIKRIYSMTNHVVVSNLLPNLDLYHITAIATNQIPYWDGTNLLGYVPSDESPPLVLHWVSVT